MNKSKIVSKTLNLQHLSHSRYDPTELFRFNKDDLDDFRAIDTNVEENQVETSQLKEIKK